MSYPLRGRFFYLQHEYSIAHSIDDLLIIAILQLHLHTMQYYCNEVAILLQRQKKDAEVSTSFRINNYNTILFV